jgi:hypothetical protein
MEKDIKLHSIKNRLGNLLIAFIMLISFAQALLITELITESVRILSCATACQQERNLGLTSGVSETEDMFLCPKP